MWKDVIPHLGPLSQVLTYDLRGHGHARAAPLPESLDHLQTTFYSFMNTLGIEKADIYSKSYGGAMAQHFVLSYPDRVRSLALTATCSKTHPLLSHTREGI